MGKYLKIYFSFFFLFLTSCGHHPEIKVLPDQDKESHTLFVALDGVSYDIVKELRGKGLFQSFEEPAPLVVTFPSATTIGFTGIFQPLKVGKVPGYEIRFFSREKNKVVGGTPWEIYKIPINYKSYFDVFRHGMYEKAIMYTFPKLSMHDDFFTIKDFALTTQKKIMLTYIGGTDGLQHVSGKKAFMRYMKKMDAFLIDLRADYYKKTGHPLKIVVFSDHGFHYDHLKMISAGDVSKVLKKNGMKLENSLKTEDDVVLVRFGLLSAGVGVTKPGEESRAAHIIRKVDGIDLVFWREENKIHIVRSDGEEAYFEYKDKTSYRYIPLYGDPLKYKKVIRQNGFSPGQWISDSNWKNMTWDQDYPDSGYRLYDAFYNLVENPASFIFSTKPDYQFGAYVTHIVTKFKGRHKGTHGGLFREVSWGVVMTDDPKFNIPHLRYDELFKHFLPQVTKAYKQIHVMVP